MRQPPLSRVFLLCFLIGAPTRLALAETPDADAGIIDQRLKEVGDPKSNIPSTEFGLYSELGRLDKEIESYQSSLVASSVIDANMRKLDEIGKEADALFGTLASATCATISDADMTALREKLQKLARTLTRIRFDFEIDDLDNPLQGIPKNDVTKNKTTLCGDLVQIGKTKRNDVKDYLDSARKQLEHQKTDPAREKTNKLIDALKMRRDILQKQIGSQVPQKAISANLAWIIAAIGLFSIPTLGGVLAFQHDIQVEWVASGQVIQFVTVMIILRAYPRTPAVRNATIAN